MAQLGEYLATVGIKDKFTGPLGKVNTGLSRLQSGLKKIKSSAFIASGGLALAGQSASVLGAGMSESFRSMVSAGADFQAQMSKVKAVTSGITNKEFAEMEAMAKRIGGETSFSAIQAAEGMQYLSQAGFAVSDTMAAITPVMNLAKAANIEVGRSADVASDLMGAFGIKAQDIGGFMDKLAVTVTNSNTTIDTLFETLKFAAPIGVAFGQSASDVLQFAGALGNVGLKGTVAGTGLKNFYATLASEKGQSKLLEMGVNVRDAEGNMKSMPAILQELGVGLKKLGDPAKQTAAIMEIFGKIGAASAANLVKNLQDSNKLASVLENSTGALSKMNEIMSANYKTSQQLSASAKNAFQIALFGKMEGALTLATKSTGLFYTGLTSVIETVPGLGIVLGGAYGIMGGVIQHSATLFHVLSTIKILMPLLSGATAIFNATLLANPITWMVVAVVGLIAVLAALVIYWDNVVSAISSAWDAIKNFASGLDFVRSALNFFDGNESPNQVRAGQASASEAQSRTINNNNNYTERVSVELRTPPNSSVTQRGQSSRLRLGYSTG